MTDSINATLMRSGTSRGLYLLADELPAQGPARDRVLLALMGSSQANQVDGVGGTVSVTNKVAIVSRCRESHADIDYLFAQVDPVAATVDYAPTCGNVLAGVAPFAIEQGLVDATHPQTVVRVQLVNTGGLVDATVHTPGGRVQYEGDTRIDGVAGNGAPIMLAFLDCAGSKTGALLPTAQRSEQIDDIEVTLLDAAMPMMMVPARALGKNGLESAQSLDEDTAFLARLEAMRLEAGRRMGLGDVSKKVIPKVSLVSEPNIGGTVRSRYFTPWSTHPSHAATGAVAVAVAASIPGTVVAALALRSANNCVEVEHAAGAMSIAVTVDGSTTSQPEVACAAVVRTARPIFSGRMYVGHVRGRAEALLSKQFVARGFNAPMPFLPTDVMNSSDGAHTSTRSRMSP